MESMELSHEPIPKEMAERILFQDGHKTMRKSTHLEDLVIKGVIKDNEFG